MLHLNTARKTTVVVINPSIKDPRTINSRLHNVDQPVIKRRSDSAKLSMKKKPCLSGVLESQCRKTCV